MPLYVRDCPNCGEPIELHPNVDHTNGHVVGRCTADCNMLQEHLKVCPLLRKHVRRSMAVVAAIAYCKDMEEDEA